MAVAIASKSTADGSGSTIVITKPTGLAVGDLLIAITALSQGGAGTSGMTPPAGWTTIASLDLGTNKSRMDCFGIIATSTEVAASNFTFTYNATFSDGQTGKLFRITDSDGFIDITDVKQTILSGTNTGISNTRVGSMLIEAFSTRNVSDLDFTTYAVANNNPTWTEEYDTFTGTYTNLGIASAQYTIGGTTGNATCNQTGADTVSLILAIKGKVNVSVSPSEINLDSSVQEPVVTGAANITTSTIDLASSVQNPVITTPTKKWINEDKPSVASFINEDKPSSI